MINVPTRIAISSPLKSTTDTVLRVLLRNCFNAEKWKLSRQTPNPSSDWNETKEIEKLRPEIVPFTVLAIKKKC